MKQNLLLNAAKQEFQSEMPHIKHEALRNLLFPSVDVVDLLIFAK